ncbi:hypothetical protein [Microvirga puerhi]|uniref:Carrier domain-containing protein n=1 Tax=Microvirga puerhi TaxID=2876078 RepID=A0ABS7VTR1_9HYPH|nr:hypothetical protein [Microvirga puerhi]MBZ6078962.1 hypothetical protein [Microvirga puerhi]
MPLTTAESIAEIILEELRRQTKDTGYVATDDDLDDVVLDGHFSLILVAEAIARKLNTNLK